MLSFSPHSVILDFPDKNAVLVENAPKAENALLLCADAQSLALPREFTRWQEHGGAGLSPALDKNYLFQGNNLVVLHSILPVFRSSISLIYIDPPYNTGNTFVYKDKMSRSLWLLFIKNRVEIAKEFLRPEGILCVQCDENEQAYLKVLLDEIYGEECFIGTVVVLTNPGGRDYRSLARTHEYLLFYGRTPEASLNPLPREKPFPYADDLGGFELRALRNGNVRFHVGNRPNLCYPFYVNPSSPDANGLHTLSLQPKKGWTELMPRVSQGVQTVWRWGKEKSAENLNVNLCARPARGNEFIIFEKYRKTTCLPRTVWDDPSYQTSKGTKQIKEIFGASVFDYPKPEGLISRIITLASKPGDRVLDFFLGSGTTAAAAHRAGRLWLGIEQMDYFHTVTVPRIIDCGAAFLSAQLEGSYPDYIPFSSSSSQICQEFYCLKHG